LTPHQRRNLERVDSNAHHLLAIINDILDISRIEAGKMPLTVTKFDLKDLVAEVLAEVEPIISRSRLAVTSHLTPDMPPLKTDWPSAAAWRACSTAPSRSTARSAAARRSRCFCRARSSAHEPAPLHRVERRQARRGEITADPDRRRLCRQPRDVHAVSRVLRLSRGRGAERPRGARQGV